MNNPGNRYVALLRAVNVGGSTTRMVDLRAAFESMGLADVSTFIQSGNVLFTTDEPEPEALVRKIEAGLRDALGLATTVFVLTRGQLQDAAANNPFDPARQDSEQRCHLMFLQSEPSPDRIEALLALQGEEYRFAVRGQVFYYAYGRQFEGRGRRTINFEKVLGTVGTARTWKVVDQLIGLLG